ncbi:MAG TPA: ComEC family competence protein [Bacteroidetes bacterium]|nr:ComEC family competence protein [Bacteroidota bacterium]
MRYFKQVPFLQILFFFIVGILFCEYSPGKSFFHKEFHFSIFIILSILTVFLFLFKRKLLVQILIPFIFIFAGFENCVLQSELSKQDHFSKLNIPDSSYYIGKINRIKKTKKGISLFLELNKVKAKNHLKPISGNLLIYSNEPYENCHFNKNDIILVPAKYFKISKNKNPLAFNPKKYYHFQNIHYYSFVKANNINLIEKSSSGLNSYFNEIKSRLINNLQHTVKDSKIRNIVIAIMLGDKQGLDNNTMEEFSLTGMRHILTVSGMHVGIVALILNFLFSLFKLKNKVLLTLKILLIICGIWFYALLTGAEPAVLRAAFMISLVLTGINLKRYINIFNVLFASAFIILLYNPFQLFQLSFILSYSAMLSILMFYKPIYSYISFKNIKVIDYLWQLISLSISAQILIFPLSLYYFHTGPSLFFITALIATPLAFVALTFGFFTAIIYSFSHYLGEMFGNLLNSVVSISLKFIDNISNISVNIGQYIYLSATDTVLIILIIVLFYIYFNLKVKHIQPILLSILILTIGNQIFKNIKSTENELVVYYVNNGILLDVYLNNKVYSIKSDTLNAENIKYSASNYRYFKGFYKKEINPVKGKDIIKKENIIMLGDKTLVLLQSDKSLFPASKKNIDYLLISGDINPDKYKLFDDYSIKTIILSKNINYSLRKLWNRYASQQKIEIWDISKKGAFISEIKSNKDV